MAEGGEIEFDRLSDGEALRAGDGLQALLRGMSRVAARLASFGLFVGIATFATGMWVFDGSGRDKWIVIGGVLAFGPVIAATLATYRVRRTADRTPEFAGELKLLRTGGRAIADVLIDGDTGRPIGFSTATLGALRGELAQRRKEFPALGIAVKAITTVPKLLVLATLGILAAGALGTILLIGGLID
jgi:hypothetical protein